MNLKACNSSTALLLAAMIFGSANLNVEAGESAVLRKQKTTDDSVELKRVWVRYEDGNHDACVQSIRTRSASLDQASKRKMNMEFDFPHTNSVVVSATDEEIRSLMKDPNVKNVVEDPKRFTQTHARRKLLEWEGQAEEYGIGLLQAKETWAEGLTGAGVKVCIVDTGFDVTHEDFAATNVTGETLSTVFEWGDDFDGHGSHVAGIVAANDNDIGLVGVAPDADLHIVQVFDDFGFVYASALVDAAYSCRDAGASIISMSLGGPEQLDEERDIFTELYNENNILSIAAAGNSGFDDFSYPASYADVLSIGAVDRNEEVAFFSTFNNMVDLAAPGVDIWSTLPMSEDCFICQEFAKTRYASLDGTSQATPHVAGAAALLFSYDTTADVSHIHNALLASARDLGVAGRDDFYGQGLVQTRDALDVLKATLSGEEDLMDWSRVVDPSDSIPTCTEEEMLVTVNLLTDRYGNETSWEVVRDEDGFTVMAGAGFGNRESSSASHCLPANCYTFQIYDSFGDGIWGEFGKGSFDVTVDEELILEGGNFTLTDSATFGGDCVPLSTDPKPELPPFVEITLVLLTDAYPGETQVTLEDLNTGEVYWEDEIFLDSDTEYTLNQEIDPTGCYSFVITDAVGDAICCDYGEGSFDLLYDGESVFSGGDFGSSTSYLVGDSCQDQI